MSNLIITKKTNENDTFQLQIMNSTGDALQSGSKLEINASQIQSSNLSVNGTAVVNGSAVVNGNTLTLKGSNGNSASLLIENEDSGDSKIVFKNKYDTPGDGINESVMTTRWSMGLDNGTMNDEFVLSRGSSDNMSTNPVFRVIGGDGSDAGETHFPGIVFFFESVTTSDINLKKNIKVIKNTLDIVKNDNFRGVSWQWKKQSEKDLNFNQGCIAQEIKDLIPAAVRKNNEGIFSVDYNAITAVLMNAVKELSFKLDKQETHIKELYTIIKKNNLKL